MSESTPKDRLPWHGYATALVAGLLGAVVFYVLHLPLPFMLGSVLGALIAANIPGLHIVRPTRLSSPVRAILGIAIGSAFSPAIVDLFGEYALSLALMLPFLIVVVLLGTLYFERVVNFDRRTAFFCSLPGGLMEMTLISEAYGADLRRVALIHTTRVFLIVYTVPFAIHHWTAADLSGQTRMAPPISALPWDQVLIVGLAALAGWWVMRRLRLPGATIIGPMLATAVLHMLGLAALSVPDELINIAQLILGAGVGSAFVKITPREMVHAIVMTLGYFLILMIPAMVVAIGIHWLTDIPLVATVLAFIPGGQAEMNIIALIVGVAVPYIALHHIVRMFLVMTVAPPLSAWMLGPPQDSKAGGP